MKTKVSDRKALLHLAVRILTLPPIVIGVTLLLMYAPTGLLTRRELLLCEVFLLVIPPWRRTRCGRSSTLERTGAGGSAARRWYAAPLGICAGFSGQC